MKNILFILRCNKTEHSGNFLRIRNIFSRLKNQYNYTLLFLKDKNNDQGLKEVSKYFNNIYSTEYYDIYHKPFTVWLGRKIRKILFLPDFLFRYSHPHTFNRIQNIIKKVIKREHIDLIHLWGIPHVQLVSSIKKIPILVDICDSPSFAYKNQQKTFEEWSFLDYLKLSRYEKKIIKKYDCCFVSKMDRDFLTKRNKGNVISNGVDVNYYKNINKGEIKNSIIFTGNMDFKPNIDAVLYFNKYIFNKLKRRNPSIKWYIVGANPANEIKNLHDGKNKIVTGFVKDIRAYISKAQISVCPMVSGAGQKNKILEAMAIGKPIITTRLGTGGIDYKKTVCIADSPNEFIKEIERLLRDGKLIKKLGKESRRFIEEYCSWDNCTKRYEQLYDRLLKN